MHKWSNIKVLGENKMINKSYVYLFLVPALAKIFEKVNSPLNLKMFGEEFEIVFELPFTWQVFFFSALFFTIGAIIYTFCAPSIVKDNNSFGDFFNEKKNFSHIDEYLEEIFWDKSFYSHITWGVILKYMDKSDITHLDKSIYYDFVLVESEKESPSYIPLDKMSILKTGVYTTLESKRYSEVMEIKLLWTLIQHEYYKKFNNQGGLERSFWLVYNLSNRKRRSYWWCSMISYTIGILLIAWVIIQSVLTVIKFVI